MKPQSVVVVQEQFCMAEGKVCPIGETWIKSAWHCINCGKHEVWAQTEDVSDWDYEPRFVCAACDWAFTSPMEFSELAVLLRQAIQEAV